MEEQIRRQCDALLQAWLELAVCIRGNRLLSHFSFNEVLVCNLLCQQSETGDPPFTAAALCRKTRLLKSQMNQILSSMERKNLISRLPNPQDRRSALITLRPEALTAYLAEHREILNIVGRVYRTLGAEDTAALTRLIHAAVEAAAPQPHQGKEAIS